MSRRSWTLLLALATIWGASYLFIKIGLRDLSAPMVAFGRVSLAAVVLVPLAASQGAFRPLRGRVLAVFAVAAVHVAGPFLLIPLGEERITSGLAGVLIGTTPILIALLAIPLDHEERSTGSRLAGIGIGFAGVVLVFGVDLAGSEQAVLGGLAVVLAGLGYSVGSFMVKHWLPFQRPLGVVAAVMTASALLLLPAALATAPADPLAVGPIAAIAALGLVGTGLAFLIFYALIGTVGPARTMLVSYIAPGFAVLYGAILLGERVTAGTAAGLALIVGGSWLAGRDRPLFARTGRPGSAPRPAPSAGRPGS